MKKILRISKAATLVTLFILITASSAPAASAAKTIAVIPKATLLHFWKVVCIGAHAATKDKDIKIIWRGPRVENKVEAQKHLLDFYITKKVDAIVIAPTRKNKINNSIRKAVAAGIKVVVIDSKTENGVQHSFIATNNYKAGKTGAELLLAKVNRKGPLLLMGNMPGSSSIASREQGFIDAVNELSPGTTVIRINILEGTRKEAELAAMEIIGKTKHLAGIFSVNEVSSEGVLHALSTHRTKDIPFVGFDYSHALLEGVQSGKISALIGQSPLAMGYTGVRTATELLEGKTVPAEMESPFQIITSKNIEEIKRTPSLKNFTPEERAECPICFN